MRALCLISMALMAALFFLPAPALAITNVTKPCCDKVVKFHCFVKTPSLGKADCGYQDGQSCTVTNQTGTEVCVARLGDTPCGDICAAKAVCNAKNPTCCQGKCGVEYTFQCDSGGGHTTSCD